MTENQRYKQFDLFSTLAALGVLIVLVFECFFVFELYNRDFSFLPVAQEPAPVPEVIEEPAPVG